MVKGDVAALVDQFIFALLDWMIENFIHTGDIGARADDRS